jgi:hypothetical protein
MSLTVLNTSNVDHTTDLIVQVLKQLSRWIAWSHNAKRSYRTQIFALCFGRSSCGASPRLTMFGNSNQHLTGKQDYSATFVHLDDRCRRTVSLCYRCRIVCFTLPRSRLIRFRSSRDDEDDPTVVRLLFRCLSRTYIEVVVRGAQWITSDTLIEPNITIVISPPK